MYAVIDQDYPSPRLGMWLSKEHFDSGNPPSYVMRFKVNHHGETNPEKVETKVLQELADQLNNHQIILPGLHTWE